MRIYEGEIKDIGTLPFTYLGRWVKIGKGHLRPDGYDHNDAVLHDGHIWLSLVNDNYTRPVEVADDGRSYWRILAKSAIQDE